LDKNSGLENMSHVIVIAGANGAGKSNIAPWKDGKAVWIETK
jgi:hypothetical protein